MSVQSAGTLGGTKMTNDEWVKQDSTGIWLPTEEGAELIGQVVQVDEVTYGASYTIKDKDGFEHRTPCHKVLQNRMAKVQIGETVRIIYKGEEPPSVKGQNPTRMYDVFVKKDSAAIPEEKKVI